MTRLNRIRAEGPDKLRDVDWLVERVDALKGELSLLLRHHHREHHKEMPLHVTWWDCWESSCKNPREALARLEGPDHE